MNESMNIFQRVSAITSELSVVAKNLSVGEGRSSYKAVGEADVLAAVKPLEIKYGVYSYPVARRIVEADAITVQKTYQGNTSESTKFFMRLETTYRFVNLDDPSDYMETTTYGDGVDPQDKAPGKAMTYSDKYALLKAYKIITGEDPDQDKSDEGKITRKKKDAIYCEDCGRPIEDHVSPAGVKTSAWDIAVNSLNNFGRQLCGKCSIAAGRAASAPSEE